MPDLIAIGQGLSALKAATEIVKTMMGLRDSAKILENTVELNHKILSAQTALADAQAEQTNLTKTIRELEEEIARLKSWEAEKQRYELKSLGWGIFAYMLKPAMRGTEPPHWVCARCYKKGEISIIQHGTHQVGPATARRGWFCPACHNMIDAHTIPVQWLD
ncbi:MAG: hypothetical protein ACLQME_03350 [Alphaproteobacteria bacterium]